MLNAWIYDAVRTPRGKAKPDGGLAAQSPQALVKVLVDAVVRRGLEARTARSLTLGCVGQIKDQGGHLALVAKLHAGLEQNASAITLNNYCVSGLTAIGLAARQVSGGDAGWHLAGGVEMMSRVPFMGDAAAYYGDQSFPRALRYVPVVLAADRLAEREGISRGALDAIAVRSQQRAFAAEAISALSASRVPVAECHVDECLRPATDAESLAAMPASFAGLAEHYAHALEGPIAHRHTIAHAPPVCDGAAIAVIGGAPAVTGRTARAKILAYCESGGDPEASLLAGFSAMQRVLAESKLNLDDFDRIEFMESFAVTPAKFLRDYPVDPEKVNVSGGHIARGHPLGASGAILLSTLLDTLDACEGRLGLLVCTAASGIGAAMIVERLAQRP